jgi:hypothetical protein
LIFIFLTPKSWLSGGERPDAAEHQNAVIRTVVLSPEVVLNEADRSQLEERIRALTGRAKVQVVNVRKVVGADGKTISFEVDIR